MFGGGGGQLGIILLSSEVELRCPESVVLRFGQSQSVYVARGFQLRRKRLRWLEV
jgi:hypothetical protein